MLLLSSTSTTPLSTGGKRWLLYIDRRNISWKNYTENSLLEKPLIQKQERKQTKEIFTYTNKMFNDTKYETQCEMKTHRWHIKLLNVWQSVSVCLCSHLCLVTLTLCPSGGSGSWSTLRWMSFSQASRSCDFLLYWYHWGAMANAFLFLSTRRS